MITPHGGVLVDRVLTGATAADRRQQAEKLPKITLSKFHLAELDNIASGLYSPLSGFMDSNEYDSVIATWRLPDGTVWPLPIVLPVDVPPARGSKVALCGGDGTTYGIMRISDVYTRDPRREARAIYGTEDRAHPGVAHLYSEPTTLIGGEIELFTRVPTAFPQYRFDPVETRRAFADRGWRTIVAFQTRNPIHRAHEYLQKCALETVDGLFLNPLVGETKHGDVPASVRMECYRAVLDNYFPTDRVLLGVFPAPMRYAGPREAVFHAICRRNYGCTHIIIGRDHAGVGNYYNTYAAQKAFDQFDPGEIGITPLKFEHAFYCRKCGGMATAKTCPHGAEDHVFLSGTKVRELLRAGKDLPPEFTRPEVASILREAFR